MTANGHAAKVETTPDPAHGMKASHEPRGSRSNERAGTDAIPPADATQPPAVDASPPTDDSTAATPTESSEPGRSGPGGRGYAIRSSRWSPTRSEFAIAVSAGLTAPMLGKMLVSTT